MIGKTEIIGGREKRPIVIADYSSEWPRRFGDERARIISALGPTAVRVEHVGSTSVPGLGAKPIIDIQVSVPDVEDEDSYVPRLTAAGYALRVREPAHRMLRDGTLTVHVHMCEPGSEWERRHLLFRDWLRVCPEDRGHYEATKRRLAKVDWPHMQAYAEAKTDIIREITARAERWAARTGWTVDGQPAAPEP